MVNVVAFLFVLFVIGIYANLWTASVLGTIRHGYKYAAYFSFVLCLLALAFHYKKELAIKTNKLFNVVLTILIICALLLGLRTLFYYLPSENKTLVKVGTGTGYNVILISFDALSANDMSLYGYARKTTPNIDRFAENGYVFENTYSNSNHTSPSVCSILTGKYPVSHGVFNNFTYLDKSIRMENIAQVLKDHGYYTAAIVANRMAHPWHNMTYKSFDYVAPLMVRKEYMKEYFFNIIGPYLANLNSNAYNWMNSTELLISYYGRKYFSRITGNEPEPLTMYTWSDWLIGTDKWKKENMAPPAMAFDNALDVMDKKRGPFFVWIHIFPPHAPYISPNKFMYSFLKERQYETADSQQIIYGRRYPDQMQVEINKLRARYDENILYADDNFGKFLESLNKKHIVDNTIIIVTADHGEIFEKGFQSHGGTSLYQPLIHIPLIIRTPGQRGRIRLKTNAEQVDIGPTILDMLGYSSAPWMVGQSLWKLMEGKKYSEKSIMTMYLGENGNKKHITGGSVAVIEENYKFIYDIRSDKGELYDLLSDPDESNNLYGIEEQRGNKLANLIKKNIGN